MSGKLIFTEQKIVVQKAKGKIGKQEDKVITTWEYGLKREDGHLILDDFESFVFRVPFGKTDCIISIFPEDATSFTVMWNGKLLIDNAKSFRCCDKDDLKAVLELLEFVV